jgi:hypothetical protein
MITKERFIQASEVEPERAGKMYDLLEERFKGDWSEASKYLEQLFEYLQKHQTQNAPNPPIL